MTMLAEVFDAVIGVDTHKHTHTAAVVIAATGAVVEDLTVSTDPAGYTRLVELADRHSGLRVWSIEGAGSYGAGLTRHLRDLGEVVIEIERPNRPARHHGAKSDPIDAARAGREALAREHHAQPRATGQRAALAVLLTTRRSAVKATGDAQRQLHALITTAPEEIRNRFRDLSTASIVTAATRLRTRTGWDLETSTYAEALRDLARRVRSLQTETAKHERSILTIVQAWRPDLLDITGIGPINAATILCAWSHPGRCRNEAAFANLAGVAPRPASSGMTVRHRLNRGGDRDLNRALHFIALTRLRHDPDTRAYAQRRRAEGKTNREIKRCLKRYIARRIYTQLEHPPTP